MVHFDDGLCITGKSVIESVCDFGLTPQHDRRRTAQIRTRASNRTFLLRGAYEADQDYPAHRLLSGAADLSLRAMPQRRNDRDEVKTKEITNDDAERTGKGWFHSQRRRANDTDGNCNRRNSASCLALRVLMRGAPCLD